MSDTFSKATRSEIMRKIKSKNNNSTELKIIHIFKKSNITGWRRNYKITGNPDFVFFQNYELLCLRMDVFGTAIIAGI
jgi:DNA mismatch endonuclease (patch repair protein)